jgi:hypothetical protein
MPAQLRKATHRSDSTRRREKPSTRATAGLRLS